MEEIPLADVGSAPSLAGAMPAPMEEIPLADVGSAPSLAGAMPAHILAKLERRNRSNDDDASFLTTPTKFLRDKENGLGTPNRRKSVGTPGPAAGTPSSRCVAEVERMRQKREEKRTQHEQARIELAGCDADAEFRQMIEQWRRLHSGEAERTTDGHGQSSGQAPRLRVCVRKRPLLSMEIADGDYRVLTLLGSDPGSDSSAQSIVVHETRRRVDMTRMLENHSFVLDDCFDEAESTKAIYSSACRPLVHAAFDGRHATIFAFGQTGSGKTYTMMGEEEMGGLYSLAASECFAILARPEFRGLELSVSFCEIYREQAFDLLPRSAAGPAADAAAAPARKVLQVLEDARGEVQLVGLAEHPVEDVAGVLALLLEAQAARRTGNNSVNERSSRSHALVQLLLRKRGTGALHGRLTLADLAGSERAADTLDASRQSRSEGADINRSLLCLKECVRAVDAGGPHVPFRGSKLTHILRESFVSAEARTAVLVHVSPAARATEQTLNSLRYAQRLKAGAARLPQRVVASRSAPQIVAPPPASPRAPPSVSASRARRASAPQPPPMAQAASPAIERVARPGSEPVSPVDEELCRQMLLSVVDCAYDPGAWAAERSALTRESDSLAALSRQGEGIDQLLANRIELFSSLRAKIADWRLMLDGHQ